MLTDAQAKAEIDIYFKDRYAQLEEITSKIVWKSGKNIKPTDLMAETYLYVVENIPQLLEFAESYGKSVQHTIYAFVKRHLDRSVFWANSTYNCKLNQLTRKAQVAMETEYAHNSSPEFIDDNIYTPEFIERFHKSLGKVDQITFQVYYYDGIQNAKELAEYFKISTRSAYSSIAKLKTLLKKYIAQNTIHNTTDLTPRKNKNK